MLCTLRLRSCAFVHLREDLVCAYCAPDHAPTQTICNITLPITLRLRYTPHDPHLVLLQIAIESPARSASVWGFLAFDDRPSDKFPTPAKSTPLPKTAKPGSARRCPSAVPNNPIHDQIPSAKAFAHLTRSSLAPPIAPSDPDPQARNPVGLSTGCYQVNLRNGP